MTKNKQAQQLYYENKTFIQVVMKVGLDAVYGGGREGLPGIWVVNVR
jgi:hypothetical protein